MNLAYVAYDRSGKRTRGTIEADGTDAAREQLRLDGLLVESIAEASSDAPGAGRAAAPALRARGGMGALKHLAMWSREMLILVRSGTPVVQAMAAIERQQADGPWKTVLTDVRTRVEEGIPLADAMAAHPGHFDAVIRSLVAAGEQSGRMDSVLTRIAEIARANLKLRQTLIGAMVYPTLLVFIGLTVSVVMLLAVVPRFADLFDGLGTPLPPTTKFMLMASEHVAGFWWAWVIGAVVAVLAGLWLVRTPSGRLRLDRVLVRLPIIGRLVRSLATARITRVLGVLLQSHVPLLQAIDLASEASGNAEYVELMSDVRDAASRGERMSGVLAASPLIIPSMAEAIRHGEENGQVGPILVDMTSFLEEENEVIVKSTLSLLEPAILGLLGLVVGGMAMSLFIPMFDAASAAGGG